MGLDSDGIRSLWRTRIEVAKDHNAITRLGVDFAGDEAASQWIDGGMAGETVTGDRPKFVLFAVGLVWIDDRGKAARSTSDKQNAATGQMRQGVCPCRQGKARQAFAIQHDAAIRLADTGGADKRNGWRTRRCAAPERKCAEERGA